MPTDNRKKETIDNAVWDALTSDSSEKKLIKLEADASQDETVIKNEVDFSTFIFFCIISIILN